jgi:predicted membrane channel-forming protein YqfA (hemolysin III family)
MRFFDELVNRTGIIGELFGFFWHNKWWWLTPMLFVLFAFGGLIIFAQSSAIAPFIYTLF